MRNKMVDTNNSGHIESVEPELELDPGGGQQYFDELRETINSWFSQATTIEEAEDRLNKLFPKAKLVGLGIRSAHQARLEKNNKSRHHSSSSSASFTETLHNITSFAVAKVSNLVRDGVGSKSDNEFVKFRDAFADFLLGDVLDLATDFVRRQKTSIIITRADIRTAMHADKDLLNMFLNQGESIFVLDDHPMLAHVPGTDKLGVYPYSCLPCTFYNSQDDKQLLAKKTYKQKVRHMVDSETGFIRSLQLLIKVYKAQLNELPNHKRDVDVLFCNIEELCELSTMMLAIFEDALESVGNEDEVPYIGSEIFDLAQAEEFNAFFTFTHQRLSTDWEFAFYKIIHNESTMDSIKTAGQSFDLAVKHVLPISLLNVARQFFEYIRDINELLQISNNDGDRMALKETLSILIKTKKATEYLLDTMAEDYEAQQRVLDSKEFKAIRDILDRKLEAELNHERSLPLPYMPPPEIYRFCEPDSKDNIQFEDFQNHRTISGKDLPDKRLHNEKHQIPVIRCATLIKLVERLTYHKYQPNIVDSFLTTYRSFISDPEELLDLLIERFKIPDPPLYIVYPHFNGSPDDLPENDRIAYKKYLKRFRQEYSKPVKMRVINVLRSWIKNHYYDFERHPTLLSKLNSFLDEVYNNDKLLRTVVRSIKKSAEPRNVSQKDELEFILSKEPPQILWWAVQANDTGNFDILTLHPVEFARQLTLIEFDLFRAIKPSELINVRDLGLRTPKEDKYESSPNLSRMTRHFTLLSYWIRKCIVEVEDFDKRIAIYNRVIEIMGVLRDCNNFTGLLSIGSAIESAPIVRLSHTKKNLSNIAMRIMDDYRELNEDHQKKLQRELKQCNPPCIPYLGSYQTKLIHAKEGNKTFIDEVDTISPTLSNEEFHSSFSNSPATPISPRTPLPRIHANYQQHQPSMPSNAISTAQNKFFGSSCILTRPTPIDLSYQCGNHAQDSCANNVAFNPIYHEERPPLGYTDDWITFNDNEATEASRVIQFEHHTHMLDLYDQRRLNVNHQLKKQQLQQQSQKLQQQNQQKPPPLTPAPPKMINFTKQRIRAGLVAEIGNYQNTPYCLTVQPEMRQYIESIESKMVEFVSSLPSKSTDGNLSLNDNVPAMTKRLDDYLFEQSERIEPKNCVKPQRSKSKLPDHWKSPGIKVINCSTPR